MLHLFSKRGLRHVAHVGTCEILFQLLVEVNYVGENGWRDFQFATHLLTVTKASNIQFFSQCFWEKRRRIDSLVARIVFKGDVRRVRVTETCAKSDLYGYI